ncbi:MAG: type 2 isopentenyl-diphosphate Delta-isomerase [Actinomycetota bacterium]|jgi:isopentenyl-diphosphate delta-isomerase|nr:type 2 isopentenyl-diphosphate Delta-isomerase [Actinomycetota bacterium]
MSPADGDDQLAVRKRDHLRIALHEPVGFASLTTGLDQVRVRPRALPELDLQAVDLSLELWGRALSAPILISCMTGGVTEAGRVNRALAQAAQVHGVALGLGSGRAVLEGGAADSFAVRDVAPDVLLLANLGVVQLHEHGPAACRRLVDRCQADVLVLHCNAVQEAMQPGGDTAFGGLLGRIAAVCEALDVPVVVKEVGFGLSGQDVTRLAEAGVAGVDVAGAGGTNWAQIEGRRDTHAAAVAAAFADWGMPTAEAVLQARRALDDVGAPNVVLIGSGGLRHGVDALKVCCLGADLAGVARGLLAAAAQGPQAATEAVGILCEQMRVAAWAAGARNVAGLGSALLA